MFGFHAENVGYCGEAGALTGSNSKSCWPHPVNDEVEVSGVQIGDHRLAGRTRPAKSAW